MNKQRLFIFIGISVIVASIIVLFIARFFLGGGEDVWLCVNGQWIKHGNPTYPVPPQASCSLGQNIDNGSNWKVYQNKEYDFEISYPADWNSSIYGPYESSSLKLAEFLLAQKSSDYKSDLDQQVYWIIDVWKPSVSASYIAKDSGFLKYDVKQLNSTGQNVQVIDSSTSSLNGNTTDNFRLFLAQNSHYVYSLKSRTCSDESSSDCIGVLSSFKLLAK